MKEPKKRAGRPRREPKPGERVPLGLRVTPELKQKLDAATEGSGRSQSQEAELRLERSFEHQALLPEVLELTYGRPLGGILMAMGRAMQDAGRQGAFSTMFTLEAVQDWASVPYAYSQAEKAAARILEALRPEGEIVLPPKAIGGHESTEDIAEEFRKHAGVGWANSVLHAIDGWEGAPADLRRDGETIRDLLGPVADRLKGG
jgi:hypothetical protein